MLVCSHITCYYVVYNRGVRLFTSYSGFSLTITSSNVFLCNAFPFYFSCESIVSGMREWRINQSINQSKMKQKSSSGKKGKRVSAFCPVWHDWILLRNLSENTGTGVVIERISITTSATSYSSAKNTTFLTSCLSTQTASRLHICLDCQDLVRIVLGTRAKSDSWTQPSYFLFRSWTRCDTTRCETQSSWGTPHSNYISSWLDRDLRWLTYANLLKNRIISTWWPRKCWWGPLQ